MLPRVLEPEVMDTADEARDYDAMDHSEVNRVFVSDLLEALGPLGDTTLHVLDLGTGTALIPIELCRRAGPIHVTAVDLAAHMLVLARQNIQQAGLAGRIEARQIDAKQMPFAGGAFDAVISNSIVHHIPDPAQVVAEMIRVSKPQATLFIRDLLRPAGDDEVNRLVQTYAGEANPHQQSMFEASLRATLTLEETRRLVAQYGFPPETVLQTTDRHWTWSARR